MSTIVVGVDGSPGSIEGVAVSPSMRRRGEARL